MLISFDRTSISSSQIFRARLILFSSTIFLSVTTFFLKYLPVGNYDIYPKCYIYDSTGLYCSGCGLTRASDSIINGDILSLLQNNLLLALALPFIAIYIYSLFVQSIYKYKPVIISLNIRDFYFMMFFIILYSVLRNFSFFSFLVPIQI